MMQTLDIELLTPSERLELIGRLWNSLDTEAPTLPLTAEQTSE